MTDPTKRIAIVEFQPRRLPIGWPDEMDEVVLATDHDSALAAKDAVIAELEARLDDDRTDARRWRALCRLLGGDDHLSIDVFIGNSGCLEADAARYRHEIGNMGWDIYGAGDLTRFIDLYRVAALQVSASPTADSFKASGE